MSERNSPNSSDETSDPTWLQLWNRWVEHGQDNWQTMMKSPAESEDKVAWREQRLQELSRGLDGYLRSPDFLKALRGYIDALIRHKRDADAMKQREIGSTGPNEPKM